MNRSKVAVATSAVIGKILSIIGYVLGGMILIVIPFGFQDMSGEGAVAGMTFLFIMLAFCVFAVIKGAKIKRRIKRFKRYVGLISAEQMTSLDNIAASTSQSVDFVRKDLQKMIDKKFFTNAYIDFKASEIVIGNVNVRQEAAASEVSQQTIGNAPAATVNVICPGCGATNTKQAGVAAECEYCGTRLS